MLTTTGLMCLALAASAPTEAKPMVITQDTVLEKGAVVSNGIVIAADGVTLDGNGATLTGPGQAGDLKSFDGVGVKIAGCANVTLRNLKVKGFATGLEGADGQGWLIEGCDFSDNFHDPEFGWGERPPMGGIILNRVTHSILRNNQANRVWDGLAMNRCDDNQITGNDFSHCSNVCLKMWTASRNVVSDNNLSYGIRIKPGEVHARDSTSVLMESGSNDNRFYRNDITHGGDGVFIRVLNGWVSTGNLFMENDCSHANNNGFESWSPGNTYIRNQANHCSYGFWLGGSDQTVLIGNEAAYNGLPDGPHNAPEGGFEHGGIVIVGGSSSHSLLEGNYCHHNNGGGIVFRGDTESKGKKWRTYHWVVQQNRLENNRFGIWGRFGDLIYLAGNRFKDNEKNEDIADTTRVVSRNLPAVKQAPVAVVLGPQRAAVGQPVVFDASASHDPAGRPLSIRWDVNGHESTGPTLKHTFDKPGFYRVSVLVDNGGLADLGFRDVVAAESVEQETGTDGQAALWGFDMQGNNDGKGKVLFADDSDAIIGKSSLRWRPDPYKGMYATAIFPGAKDAKWNLTGKKSLVFWLKAQNGNIPSWQSPGPVITLYGAKGTIQIEPAGGRNLLTDAPFSEARWTWMRFEVPLADSPEWKRTETGTVGLEQINAVGIALDSWGGDPFTVWLDGMRFE